MNKNGFVLLLTLSFIILITSIVLNFHNFSSIQIENLKKTMEEIQAEYLAETGIYIGKRIIQKSYLLKDEWREGKDFIINGNRISIKIEDEDGKIYLNGIMGKRGWVNPKLLKLLKNLFTQLGISENLVDCLLDWMDEDEIERVFGAETLYYHTLSPPYHSPNRPLFTLDELYFIKGFTPQILKGDEETPGLLNFVTLYSNGKININTASPFILKAMGFNENEVAQIINIRKKRPLSGGVLYRINRNVYLNNRSLITYMSNYFCVISEGITESGIRKRVKAYFKKDYAKKKVNLIRVFYE